MKRTYYIAPDGKEFGALPKAYAGVYHLTVGNMARFGWTTREVEVQTPAEDTEGRITAYGSFVAKLSEYAGGLGVDLAELSDAQVTIPGLKTVAAEHGASEADIRDMQNELMLLAFECMAQSGETWQRTWREIKRFMREASGDR